MTPKKGNDLYDYYWEKFEKYSKLPMENLRGRKNGRTFFKVFKGLTIVAIPTLNNLDKKSKIRCCVEILIEYPTSSVDKNREAFKQLHDYKEEIENDIGVNLCWLPHGEQGTAKRAKISCCKVFDSNQEDDWQEHYPWFIETIKAFNRVFTHRLEKIKL